VKIEVLRFLLDCHTELCRTSTTAQSFCDRSAFHLVHAFTHALTFHSCEETELCVVQLDLAVTPREPHDKICGAQLTSHNRTLFTFPARLRHAWLNHDC